MCLLTWKTEADLPHSKENQDRSGKCTTSSLWVRMHRKLRGTGAFTGLRLPNRSLRNKTEVANSRAAKKEGHTFLKESLMIE